MAQLAPFVLKKNKGTGSKLYEMMAANQPDLLWLIRDSQEYIKGDELMYFQDQLGKLASSKNEKIRKIQSSVTKGFNRKDMIRVPHPTEGNT